jgi:hypothetical protein
VSDGPGNRLRVALFHALPPGGAIRALYEVVKRFPQEVEVDLFAADLAAVDRRFIGLAAGTSHLDLSGVVASTRNYTLPNVARLIAPHLGRIGAFVVGGEAMRHVQRHMADDINGGGYDVAFVHACRFSLSVPIAEWLTVPGPVRMGEVPNRLSRCFGDRTNSCAADATGGRSPLRTASSATHALAPTCSRLPTASTP